MIHLLRKQQHPFKEPARIDPYRSDSKPKAPLYCPKCGARNEEGRWIVAVPSSYEQGRHEFRAKCPACRQLDDHYALGVVELRGLRWKLKLKGSDVIKTARHTEWIARLRNDQERILWISSADQVTKIYVSLPELARRIGRELEKTFKGKTTYSHSTEEPYVRVRWWSDGVQFKAGTPISDKSKSFRRRGFKFYNALLMKFQRSD